MSNRETGLFLQEEILLLALRGKEGTFFSKMYHPALAGAIMAELLLGKRVEVEEGKKKHIRLLNDAPFGDAVLDEALEKVRTAKRKASLKTWVSRFHGISKLHHKVAAGLCRKGVLREDEGQVLVFFRRKIYPEVDPRPERRIIERMRRGIFSDSQTLKPRTVILISLAKSADLLSVSFEKWQLKQRKKRIERIVKGEMLGRAAKEIVEATQAAILVAVMIPAMAASVARGR